MMDFGDMTEGSRNRAADHSEERQMFRKGQRVFHRRCGTGTVYAVNEKTVAVEFDRECHPKGYERFAIVWHYSLFGI